MKSTKKREQVEQPRTTKRQQLLAEKVIDEAPPKLAKGAVDGKNTPGYTPGYMRPTQSSISKEVLQQPQISTVVSSDSEKDFGNVIKYD
jgi:hypothetical protein